MALSPQTVNAIRALTQRYPVKKAALLPALHLAQKETGALALEVQSEVAALLDISGREVHEVVEFYTMFHDHPVGRHHIQICTNLSCALRGADHLCERLQQRLGLALGETSADGRYTLEEVECLASCGTAPMMQVNETFHESLDENKLDAVLEKLK